MDDDASYTTADEPADRQEDAAEVRYGLTALGEALIAEREGARRFRGFGPCAFAVA